MDPASIIGTAAAAVQLAGLCKNLFCLLKTAKPTLNTYAKSTEELLAVSDFIIRRSQLHTLEITNLVQSLIELLNSLNIPSRASKNRLTAFWTIFWKGGELHDVFVTLEAKKSTILLCIAGVHSSLLQDIRDDIANMSSKPQDHPASAGVDTTTPFRSPAAAVDPAPPPGLPPTANEGRSRDPGSSPPGQVVPSEEQSVSGRYAIEKTNVVVDYVEMDSPEVKALQVCGFANNRQAGEKERVFIGRAVMKGKGQMVIGFSSPPTV